MTDNLKTPTSVSAGSSAWAAQAESSHWTTAANWDPATVPTNTARFGNSTRTAVGFVASVGATVESIEFTDGAPSYTITFTEPAPNTPALTISGAGVVNYSGKPQRFVVASSAAGYENPQLKFINSATAGGNDVEYAAGPSTPVQAAGGVIGFHNTSNAGSASFIVRTGAGTPPSEGSTVGGEVSFSDSSSASTARFTIFGSTSTTDGDTFGNVVFHNTSSAARGVFTNVGGTVPGGDGGNTQFYDNASAGNGVYHNEGAVVGLANGGDVAIDGSASAAQGQYHNYAATASGGYGGVTSFNNNAPCLPSNNMGASAGNGFFHNHGATGDGQGGGHTYFTAKYGSPTAANGTFINYGSAVAGNQSCAGHTVFSISLPREKDCGSGPSANYSPDAGRGVFWNLPGSADAASGGYTQFTVYADPGVSTVGSNGPTAGNATFVNMGAVVPGAYGGETLFGGTSSAMNAELIAFGGSNDGGAGTIAFSGDASGGTASVQLHGGGTIDISGCTQSSLTIGSLELAGGCIVVSVGAQTTCLIVSELLAITATPVRVSFKSANGITIGTPYVVLTAPNLGSVTADQFTGSSVGNATPSFSIVGNELRVTFNGVHGATV
ncbi:MAG: hypothetical protein ABI311_07290 [Gemmatimonadaceae bacterium]